MTEGSDLVTLGVVGKVTGICLGELRREIERIRRIRKEIALDLSEVTLLDRQGVEFLAAQIRDEVRLINCPEYLEPWILKATLS